MKPKISDVLHYAADKYLSEDGISRYKYNGFTKYRFSCGAIGMACDALNVPELVDCIVVGLENMGCDTNSGVLFKQYGDKITGNPDVQGMRYFWLKWAALMAEEQGQ